MNTNVNVNVKTVLIGDVTEKKESKMFQGFGLFATTFISKNTLLNVDDKCNNLAGFMNDADFKFPGNLTSYAQLYNSIKDYERVDNKVKSTRNNVDHTRYITLSDILPGEELTKSYGVPKWSIFLSYSIIARCWVPPFNADKLTTSDNVNDAVKCTLLLKKYGSRVIEETPELKLLNKVLKEFGYNFTIN